MLLFERCIHDAIREGRVTVVYRNWDKPRVNPGQRYRAGHLGDIQVEEVSQVPLAGITEEEARAAGEPSLAEWRRRYQARNPKADFQHDLTYLVRFCYLGNEAQVVRDGRLSEEALRRLDRALARVDVQAYEGEWTMPYLATLMQKRWMRPGELVQHLVADQDTVRRRMNVLADMGLVRADPGLGYSLSAGGRKLYAYRMRG